MNLQEQLIKETKIQRRELSTVDVITDVNRLLEEKGSADRSLLNAMGLDGNIKKAIELQGIKSELRKLEQQYEQIFTTEEIKSIACKYGLKFLRTDRFKGDVDTDLPRKVREFGQQHGIELNEGQLQYKFMILAPSKMFHLENTPKPVRVPKVVSRDPLLFYKVDDNRWALVHKWGKDLTWWRRLIGWKYTNPTTYWASWCSIGFLTTLLVLLTFWPSFFAIVPALIVGIISGCISISSEKEEAMTWSDSWDEPYKMCV